MAKRNRRMGKQECECKAWKCHCHKGGCGAVYGLGFIGAAIYFISQTSGFWNVILAILKSCVWPVFVVMKVLGL
jgi:hypothetical protein